ncbi:MAG: SH3 domain-containing protein [Lachnospiraceae bacterium]|nr:SH3 domain-containing protein [Lachnospiraceae bacterium]
MKDNKNTGFVFSIDKIAQFCKANFRYVSAGVMTAALVLVLSVSACNDKNNDDISGKEDNQQEERQDPGKDDIEDFTENEMSDNSREEETSPEITELLSTYYNSYAAGDLDKLSGVTKYLSDMEKDYINMMNEHVESYNNVSCVVENGRTEDEYIVSVEYGMKFAGVEDALPGMNVFYVQTNKKGELYINNKYSSFNREMGEQKTKKKILKLIEEFENSEKIDKLRAEIQTEYDEIIEGNDELQKKVNEVAEAISNWKDTYTPPAEEPEQEEPESQPEPEETAPEEESAPQESEETPEETEDDGSESESSDDGESSGINYVPEGKVLTANNGYNVRASMSETAELVGTTAVGDSITVILSYAEGWTKVEWNGVTGYIRTDLLLSN